MKDKKEKGKKKTPELSGMILALKSSPGIDALV